MHTHVGILFYIYAFTPITCIVGASKAFEGMGLVGHREVGHPKIT